LIREGSGVSPMKKTYMQPQMAVVKTALREGVLTQGSLTTLSATFHQEDATSEGMTKEQGDWDEWE